MTDVFGGNVRAIIFLVLNLWSFGVIVAPAGDKPVVAVVATIWFLFFIALFWRDLMVFLRGKKNEA